MGKIITFLISWLTKKALLSVAYYALALTYFLSIVASIVAFFYGLDYLVQTIRGFLGFISSYSGGSGVCVFFSLLNCMGISQAVRDVSPFFSAAVVFLFSRILISFVNDFYKKAFGILTSIMQTGL